MKFKIGDCVVIAYMIQYHGVVVDIKPSYVPKMPPNNIEDLLYYVQWDYKLDSSPSTGAYYDFQLALDKEKIRENKLKELLEC